MIGKESNHLLVLLVEAWQVGGDTEFLIARNPVKDSPRTKSGISSIGSSVPSGFNPHLHPLNTKWDKVELKRQYDPGHCPKCDRTKFHLTHPRDR